MLYLLFQTVYKELLCSSFFVICQQYYYLLRYVLLDDSIVGKLAFVFVFIWNISCVICPIYQMHTGFELDVRELVTARANARGRGIFVCLQANTPTTWSRRVRGSIRGIEGLCHTKSALAQACCVECTAISMIASFPLSGGLCFPLLCCVPSTRGARTNGRGAFERGSARRGGSARGAARGARPPVRHPPRRIVSSAGAYTSPTLPWSATPSSASTGCPTTSSSAGT